MTNNGKRSVYFPEGYFPICKCNSCGEPYDPANGHICGRGPDPFRVRERERDDGEDQKR